MTETLMADLIEAAFLNVLRESKSKEKYRVSAKERQSIEKAAKICVERDFDPDIFVAAQNCYRGNKGDEHNDYFFATYLHCHNCCENYEKYKDRSNVNLDSLVNVMINYVVSIIHNTRRSVENILLDDLIDLTPWFRITITKEPIQSVLSKYLPAAKRMMTPKLMTFIQQHKLLGPQAHRLI